MMKLLTIVILLISCYQQLELCSALSNEEIAKQLEFLTDQYLKQQQELVDVKQELKDVKQELKDVNQELKDVNQELKDVKQENGEIKSLLTSLTPETEPESDESKFSNQSSTNDKSEIRTPAQNGSMDKRLLLRALSTTSPDVAKIAFTAMLTTTPSLGDGQTVEFKNVITNVGNGYEPRHGRFIAPVKGVYQMGFTLMSASGTSGYLDMVRNGAYVTEIYIHTDYSMCTQIVYIMLEQGDMVWIRRAGSTAIKLNAGYNTFFGALLFQI